MNRQILESIICLSLAVGIGGLVVLPVPGVKTPPVESSAGLNIPVTATKDPRVRAFLETIAWAEGTFHPEGWRTQYTDTRFRSLSDHPRQIHCGKIQGRRVCSDAAGAFQFLSTTWDRVAKQEGLEDFSPEAQTKAALVLLKQEGAFKAIKAGNLEEAVRLASSQWAGLPGSYAQNPKRLEELIRFYKSRMKNAPPT